MFSKHGLFFNKHEAIIYIMSSSSNSLNIISDKKNPNKTSSNPENSNIQYKKLYKPKIHSSFACILIFLIEIYKKNLIFEVLKIGDKKKE